MKRSPCRARRIAYLTSLVLVLFQLATTLTVTAQQNPDATTSMARQRANLTTLSVSVTDGKDGYVWGLDKSAFSLYDNKVQQEITFFEGEESPVSMGIMLDTSGSMDPYDSRFKSIRDALARFLDLSLKTNEYFVIGFNKSPFILSD